MSEASGAHDFDFYVGRWRVHNRRLRERLKGSTDWEEFEGISEARMILGGVGNSDELTLYRESGVSHGFTLRLFDAKAQEWSIYWASSLTGSLDVPMVGKFVNGRGEFYAHELHNGQHVYSRFIWSEITANSARWEQALSADGGRTWETNWIMESTREA
ncbi:MAG: hypothetical protein U0694_16370 [Anaerolineae bacterium]